MRSPNGKAKGLGQERVEQILAAYGAKPEHWPAAERPGMLAELEVSSQAQARLAEEQELDRALEHVATCEPSAKLRAAILQAVPAPKRSWSSALDAWAESLWPTRRVWAFGGALAAAAVLGVATGLVSPDTDSAAADTDVAAVAFDDYAQLGDVP